MKIRLAEAFKRSLAGALSVLVFLGGPGLDGWSRAWADDENGTRRVWDNNAKRFYDVKNADVKSAIAAVQNARGLSSQERDRAVDYLRRMDQSADASPELMGQIQQLQTSLSSLKDDQSAALALTHFFTNSANEAQRLDQMHLTSDVVVQEPNYRHVRVRNAGTGQMTQDVEVRRVEKDFQSFIVRQPDPGSGNLVIEQLDFTYNDSGAEKQKVAYSRAFNKMVHMVVRIFWGRSDLQDLIDDPSTPEPARVKLRAQLADIQAKFPKDILDFDKEMTDLQNKVDSGGKFSPDELRQMAERLKNMQARVLAYYNNNQLDLLQKSLLAQFVYYFTSVSGLSYNPFDKKDGLGVDVTQMKKEDIEKILKGFESGKTVASNSSTIPVPWLQSMADMKPSRDLENALPQEFKDSATLKAIAMEAIQFLGFAADAQKRLFVKDQLEAGVFKSGVSEQQRQAIMAEMDRWVRLAQLQIQRFQVQTMAVEVWRLKNNKMKGGMGIKSDEAMSAEAQRLLDQAEQQMIPEMEKLQKQSIDSMLGETASAFATSLMKARYTTREKKPLDDDLKDLIAQAQQMRALYLSRQFDIFSQKKVLQEALNDVNGDLYQEFLKPENQTSEMRRAIELFDSMIGRLQKILDGNGDVSAVKDALAPLEPESKQLFALLGMANGPPSAEMLRRTQTSLKVYQTNLSQIIATFSSNMQTFDMLNQLNLYAKKMLSSEKTDDEHWYEFRFLDRWMNIGGGRDKAGELGVQAVSYKAWQVLFQNKAIRDQAVQALAAGDYAQVNKLLAELDPEATAKTKARLARDKQDPDGALDILGMLTQNLKNDDAQIAQANINSAFKQLPTAAKGFMGGTMAFDLVIGAALIAVAGPVIMVALKAAAELINAIAKALEMLSKLQVLQKLGVIGRMISAVLRGGAKTLKFAGRVVKNMSDNIRVVLRLPTNSMEAVTRAMSLRGAGQLFYRGLAFQTKMAVTMAAASALMSTGMYAVAEHRQPGSSSYKGYGDAIEQGALGGASFGAKTGFLMLFNPLPTSTLSETGAVGRLRSLGESAGPMEALSKAFGRMAAGADADAASLAKVGMWRQMGMALENIRPTPGIAGLATSAGRQLAKLALTTGGFADGALKYFLVAEISKEVLRDVSYGIQAAFGGAKSDFGGSGHVNAFVMSEAWGEMAQQTSWLLLPQAPHQDPGAIEQSKETFRAMRTLDGEGRLMEVFSPDAIAKGEIRVERPFWSMSMGEKMSFAWGKVREMLGGKAPDRPKDVLKITPDIQLEAFRRISDDVKNGKIELPQLLAMSVVGDEHLNSLRDVNAVMEEIFAGKEQAPKGEVVVEGAATDAGKVREALNMILMPALRDRADTSVRARLAKDPALLKDVVGQTKAFTENFKAYQEQLKRFKENPDAFPNGKPKPPEIIIDGVSIKNPEVVEKLANTAAWVVIEDAPGISAKVLDRVWAGLGTKSVPTNAERITERVVDALYEASKGAEANGRPLTKDEIRQVTGEAMTEVLKTIGEGADRQMYRDAVEHHRQSFEGSGLDRFNAESFVKDAVSGKLQGDKEVRAKRIQQFSDLADLALQIHGVTRIPNYKAIQTHAAKEFLELLGQNGGDATKTLKAFLLVHTGAGKTSLSMIYLMPILKAMAKEAGLQGIDFNTHGELLRAQAQADYASYFRGRTPDFRIQTLSDLAAEHLTKKSQNGLSPLETRVQIYDEFDQLFLDPPTSLGKDMGGVERGSPLFKVHERFKAAIDKLCLDYGYSGERMERELKTPGSAFAGDMARIEADFAGNLRKAIGESAPWFGGDARTKKDAKQFRAVVEGSQRFSFSLDGYARTMAHDFYKTAALQDPSLLVMDNPNKGGKPLQIHGGSQVYTDLDTGGQRTYFELQKNADRITNPFENLEMTNAGDVVRSTRFMVALSGTLPEALRPILEEANVQIRGEGTRTADGRFMIAAGRDAAMQEMADAAYKHAISGNDKLSVVVINTPGELQKADELLQKKGISSEQIVRYSVGDTFKAEKLFRADEVRANQNLDALEKGTAKVVLLTVGASRGLDMKLKAYGEVNMYGLDPQKTSLVNFTQGQGRIDPDRLGDKAVRDFFYFTDAKTLRDDPVFREVALPVMEKARLADEAALMKKVADGYREQMSGREDAPAGLEKMTDREVVEHFMAGVVENYKTYLVDGYVEDLVRKSTIDRGGKKISGKFANEAEWQAMADKVEPAAKALAEAQISRMSNDEILQRGLEDASVTNLETLGAARDLVLSRRVRETFGLDLSQFKDDPRGALRAMDAIIADETTIEYNGQKVAKNAAFVDMMLRGVQRQVEHNALNSSMIFQKEPLFKPETLPTLGIVGIGVAGGVMSAITLAHFLPTLAAWGSAAPYLHFLGAPNWLYGQPLAHEPMMMLAAWLSLRMTTRKTFVQKPKPYGGDGPKTVKKPAGPPPLPGPNDDEDLPTDGAPDGGVTPPPAPVAPK